MRRLHTSTSLGSILLAAVTALGGIAIAGCSDSGGETGRPCFGAKCDIPDGEGGEMCMLRRRDAFNANQVAFTETALRWSCQDVPGVTGIDRGQEYCEYFSIVGLPAEEAGGNAPDPAVLGRLIRIEPEGDDEYATFDQTPIGVDLTANQVYELEADPTAVVGQCVFTSWNLDIETPIPACVDRTQMACPDVMGVTLDAENFRMKFDFNSFDAAAVLTEDCLSHPKQGDLDNGADPLHDDFFRGCMINAEVNETQYRKSDSTVCAAVNRLAECECWIDDFEGDFPEVISPADRRGFPLGTWSGQTELPVGCKYVELGDGSNTIVSCDLAASDVLAAADDPKSVCREKYADNVVVHVPIAADQITCTPANASSPYADTCSDMPWVLESGDSGQY